MGRYHIRLVDPGGGIPYLVDLDPREGHRLPGGRVLPGRSHSVHILKEEP